MRVVSLLLILCGLPLLAQDQKFFPIWNLSVIRDIGLTDTQSRDVRAAVRDYRSRLIDLKAHLDKAEAEVEDAFNEDSFDSRRAADACEKVITARAELARVFSQMNTRLRAILTTEQWRELQKRSLRLKETAVQQKK